MSPSFERLPCAGIHICDNTIMLIEAIHYPQNMFSLCIAVVLKEGGVVKGGGKKGGRREGREEEEK